MARTVERKYEQAIEQAYIAAWMLYQGSEPQIEERIDWAIARLEEARDYHRKSVKKQSRTPIPEPEDNQEEIDRKIAEHEQAIFDNPDPAYGP